jgi:hypothetical protein
MTSSFGIMMQELRSKEETLNVGTKWTIEEDNKLVQEITDNKTYEEIALEHKRTINSIRLRVISHIIYPKIKDDVEFDIKALSLKYKIYEEQIIMQLNKIKNKELIKQSSVNEKKSIYNHINNDEPTNKQIFEYLKQLDNKINEINSKLDNLEYLR